LIAFAVAGCAFFPQPSARTLADDLKDAEARWAEKGPDSYQLTMRDYCLCPFQEPVRATVKDGRVVSITTLDGAPADPSDVSFYPLLVESAFKVVEDNLGAHSINVAFDPDLGFPAQVSVDPDAQTNDDEINFDVSNFVAGS
jgi:hypothetical protein